MHRKALFLGNVLLLALASGAVSADQARDPNAKADLIVTAVVTALERTDDGYALNVDVRTVEKGKGVKKYDVISTRYVFPRGTAKIGQFFPPEKALLDDATVRLFLQKTAEGKYDIIYPVGIQIIDDGRGPYAAADLVVTGTVSDIERKDADLTLKITAKKLEKGKGVKTGDVVVGHFRYPPGNEPTGQFFPKEGLVKGQHVRAFLAKKDGKFTIISVSSLEGTTEKKADEPQAKTLPEQWLFVAASDKDGGITLQHACLTKKRWVIKGDQLCLPNSEHVFTYTLDPSKKWIDTDGCKVTRLRGIYQVNTDNLIGITLTICLGPPGGDRPSDFTAPPRSGRVLMVLMM